MKIFGISQYNLNLCKKEEINSEKKDKLSILIKPIKYLIFFYLKIKNTTNFDPYFKKDETIEYKIF